MKTLPITRAGRPATDDELLAAVVGDPLPPLADDPVNHPKHYTGHPSGVECIQVTEHENFCRGNAIKYIWRAGDKGDVIEDLEKARWYLDREIQRVRRERTTTSATS